MASIREVRKMLLPVLIGLVVIDLACVGYLLSPLGRSREARQRDLEGLKVQLAAKRQEVLPARGMDGKLKHASTDIADFYTERFPSQYSAVSEVLTVDRPAAVSSPRLQAGRVERSGWNRRFGWSTRECGSTGRPPSRSPSRSPAGVGLRRSRRRRGCRL